MVALGNPGFCGEFPRNTLASWAEFSRICFHMKAMKVIGEGDGCSGSKGGGKDDCRDRMF